MEEIESVLRQFEGGVVELNLNDGDGIAELFLSNPDKKNAITGQMLIGLERAITRLENWSRGKALLFYTDGDCFCSGMDLRMVAAMLEVSDGSNMAAYMNNVTSRLSSLPLLTVVALQGHALGGGAELVTCFDFRIMSERASIRFVQAKMGVTTGIAGGGTRLCRLIGPSKGLEILISGSSIDADKAQHLGLATGVTTSSPEEFLTEVRDWLSSLMEGKGAELIRGFKQIATNSQSLPVESAIHLERNVFVDNWGSEALRGALAAKTKHE